MKKTKTFIVAAMLTVASLVQAKDYHVSIVAGDNTSIIINPVNGIGSSEEYQVKKGEREVTINTSNYAKGNYIITLLNDGKKLDSRQIICK